jgi:hypothetical protein
MKNTKTEKALSSLDWAIAQSVGEPRQPDEFTCIEFMKAGGGGSRPSASSRLNRMVTDGMLTKRQFSIDGSRCTLYRKA